MANNLVEGDHSPQTNKVVLIDGYDITVKVPASEKANFQDHKEQAPLLPPPAPPLSVQRVVLVDGYDITVE